MARTLLQQHVASLAQRCNFATAVRMHPCLEEFTIEPLRDLNVKEACLARQLYCVPWL